MKTNTVECVIYVRRGLVEHEIAVNFDYEIENDGIGTYEFGGRMCYDSGKDYPVLTKINEAYMIYHNSNNRTFYKKIDPYSVEFEVEEYIEQHEEELLSDVKLDY